MPDPQNNLETGSWATENKMFMYDTVNGDCMCSGGLNSLEIHRPMIRLVFWMTRGASGKAEHGTYWIRGGK
jgi:hypothetical protein